MFAGVPCGRYLVALSQVSWVEGEGYVADLTYGAVMQSAWTRGEPMPRRILGGIKWSRSANTPIVTFRCQSCGYLEAYAPPA